MSVVKVPDTRLDALATLVVAKKTTYLELRMLDFPALTAGKKGPAPQLLIHDGDVYKTVALDWHGGLRYPRLEKVGKGPGTLDALLAPL